jgi:hypothetical protein
MARRMTTGGAFGLRIGWGVWVCAAAFLAATSTRAADDPTIDEFLAAGEFAPAWDVAQGAPADQRDAMLAEIAAAQARAGARQASRATASEIGDDLLRGQILGESSGQPVGIGGGRGGAPEPDFDALIELITSTIEPQSWDDVGGPGSIAPFETGVRVDAQGFVERRLDEEAGGRLESVRRAAQGPALDQDVRRTSALRKVSLTRLERQVQLRLAAGRVPDDVMQCLAGLERIEYVLVYPETRDIVLAGPAGGWQYDAEARPRDIESGRPVMRLDDLVVILRALAVNPDGRFGCSITPSQEALAKTRAFLEESSKRPLKAGQRGKWLAELRDTLGRQAIEFYGVDPRTRVARVMFEADYRMKLVGIGLEEGTLDVPSYLESIQIKPGEAPPPLGVLRWWFTINYQSLSASRDRNAFEFHGQGVKMQSENELLAEDGQRVHTGESEPLNQLFAQNFTRHFEALAEKYPIYADLRTIYDLALAAALIKAEDLPARVGWHMACFGDPRAYPVALEHAPAEVESVINHRVVNKVHVLAGVSGGVRVDPSALVTTAAIQTDREGRVESEHVRSTPTDLAPDAWWWD